MQHLVEKEIKWRTEVACPAAPERIRYGKAGILALGSCFAEHIGAWLGDLRYRLCLNPFGTLFNPYSMAQALEWLGGEQPFGAEQLQEHQGLWFSFLHHGRFSRAERDEALELMRAELEAGRRAWRQADWGILTLGTAWVYALSEQPQNVVANCHKLPSERFVRYRLSVEQIVERLAGALQTWKEYRPNLRIVLSVSPVRHVKDGLIENQRSKAVLLLAAQELSERLPWLYYFPAYEILMDELRDYRFYDSDLCHPSPDAVRHIKRRFEQSLLHSDDYALRREFQRLAADQKHRPLHPDSPENAAFHRDIALRLQDLKRRCDWLEEQP